MCTYTSDVLYIFTNRSELLGLFPPSELNGRGPCSDLPTLDFNEFFFVD